MTEWILIIVSTSAYPLWLTLGYGLQAPRKKLKKVIRKTFKQAYVYDPSLDEDRVMSGEVESYFD